MDSHNDVYAHILCVLMFCTHNSFICCTFNGAGKIWESSFDHELTLRHTLDRYRSAVISFS